MTRVLFLILFSSTAFAQIDTSFAKIKNRGYHECHAERPNDLYTPIVEINISYPHIIIKDKSLQKFLNDTIEKLFQVYGKVTDNAKCKFEGPDLRDPSFTSTYFKINNFNSKYFSLTRTVQWGGGGGSGFATHQYSSTFDFANGNFLRIRDIVDNENDSAFYTTIISILKTRFPDDFKSPSQEWNPKLFQFTSTQESEFGLNKESIIISWEVVLGGAAFSRDAIIPIKKYSYLFKNEFLNSMKK